MDSPYQNLDARNFWKTGVEQQSPFRIDDFYRKKFDINGLKVATAGSCFAQHIARNLRARGVEVLDMEPAPRWMSTPTANKFGYGLYSARYGNIYHIRQLLQILQEAFEGAAFANPVWEAKGRYHDAFRPSVEPKGLTSPDEVMAHRALHLKAVHKLFSSADLMIFTMGLTEGWVHNQTGTTYPTAPGTIAGTYDPDQYGFKNFTHGEIMKDFDGILEILRAIRPNLKILLTVSPVPLTATASDQHVLPATVYSKSVLRSVAGELTQTHDFIDYFPSYEIIASHFSRGMFYGPNLRSVEESGVENVMRLFFDQHRIKARAHTGNGASPPSSKEDVVCEEELLNAFTRPSS